MSREPQKKGSLLLRHIIMRLANLLSRTWLRCLLLVGLGFVIRMPALSGLPIWDDDYLIGENPFIKSPLLFGEAFRHYLFLGRLFCPLSADAERLVRHRLPIFGAPIPGVIISLTFYCTLVPGLYYSFSFDGSSPVALPRRLPLLSP